eukprot:6492107-Amphidinium_carterae.3
MEQVQALKQALPKLPVDWALIEALPQTFGKSFVVEPMGCEAVSKACGFAHKSLKTNLLASLDKEWDEFHRTVLASSGKDSGEDTSGKRKPCKDAGMCICKGGDGYETFRLRNQVLKHFKAVFKGKEGRNMLVSGKVVVHCFRTDACASCLTDGTLSIWLHVGHMSLSPYRPTFMLLRDHPSMGQNADDHPPGIATDHICTEFQALRQVCCKCAWSMGFWHLESTGRPLTQLNPGSVSVAPYSQQDIQLWPIQRQKRQSKNRAPKVAAVPAPMVAEPDTEAEDDLEEEDEALAAISDEEGEDDDEFWESLLLEAEAMDTLTASMPTSRRVPAAAPMVDEGGVGEVQNPEASMPRGSTDIAPLQLAVPKPASVVSGTDLRAGSAVGRAPAIRGITLPAAAVARVEGGTIAYHHSKEAYEAICSCAHHGKCVLTRSARAHKRGQKPGEDPRGGRPLGFLLMWLRDGCKHTSKASHWDKSHWTYSHADRLAAREALANSDEGRDLLSFERPRGPNEPPEPVLADGVH